MAALQDGKDAVLDVLEGTPVEATVIKPTRAQREVFEACSPNLGNVYNDALADDSSPGAIEKRIETLLGDAGTSGPRQKRVLGGFLGAAFPPGTATINEEGGLPVGARRRDWAAVPNKPLDAQHWRSHADRWRDTIGENAWGEQCRRGVVYGAR